MARYQAGYTAEEKVAFGRALKAAMIDKGLNGSQLAREATKHLPQPATGKKNSIGRDNISWYCTGRSIPTEMNMAAIAKVLETTPDALLPRPHTQKPGDPPQPSAGKRRDIRTSWSGDTMNLIVNVDLPVEVGTKILLMIQSAVKPD